MRILGWKGRPMNSKVATARRSVFAKAMMLLSSLMATPGDVVAPGEADIQPPDCCIGIG